jgi:hypothetical protein
LKIPHSLVSVVLSFPPAYTFKQRVAGSNPARLTKVSPVFQAVAVLPQIAVRVAVRVLSVSFPRVVRHQPVLPSKQLLRFPLSWRRIRILLETGSSPALRDQKGTLLDYQNLNRELSGKRLELLKEIIPRLSRLAVFGTTAFPGNAQGLREVEAAADPFGIKLQSFHCLSPNDIETAFRAASRERANAVLVLPGPVFNSHQTKIAELGTAR